jgi:ribosomal protein S18 acetylase RimI-like enzyme
MAVIRTAAPEDADAIAEIEVETWQSAYAGMLPDPMLLGMDRQRRGRSWGRTVAHERGRCLVAAEDDRILGFGSFGPQRLAAFPHAGEVFTLYVEPDRQNQGIGRLLLTQMFDLLRQGGVNSALVWVLCSNPARFFYERMGGKLMATRAIPVWRGQSVDAAGYGWPDLSLALGPRSADPSRID